VSQLKGNNNMAERRMTSLKCSNAIQQPKAFLCFGGGGIIFVCKTKMQGGPTGNLHPTFKTIVLINIFLFKLNHEFPKYLIVLSSKSPHHK
jgi:hypothetical protein